MDTADTPAKGWPIVDEAERHAVTRNDRERWRSGPWSAKVST
ncbi:hypothetical protein CURTO8I2_80127 [Curtobacterium sp. 8I-2]|nr:hypothetical protein CURTO8I2_80127 [Curtobacterium sp. 8I-2]